MPRRVLPERPARLPASVARQVINNRDPDLQMGDLIASPLIGIVHLRRGWLCQSAAALYSYALRYVVRTWTLKDGQIGSMCF
jgi:hypothetical protein